LRKVLFIPGPTEADPDILAELTKPVMAHYGQDWGELYNDACEDAKTIFNTKSTVTIVPVPGTLAMEMSIPNILEDDDDKIINVTNGFFGDAQGDIIREHGAHVIEVRSRYGVSINLEKIKEALDKYNNIKAVYVIHNDTSSGVLNNVREIGKIVRKYDKLFVVDAVSSFGGVEFNFDRWGVDYALGYASKCLSGVNGVCPIAISERFVEYASNRKKPIKSFFFNIPTYLREVKNWSPMGHPHPTSVPTSVIRAFALAEKKALEEGLEKRYERHSKIGKAYRAAVRAMNLDVLPEEEDASPTLTAVKVPDGMDKKIISLLIERFGLMTGSGYGEVKGKIIRIGHMGITASPQYLIQLVPALELVLKELKIIDKVGPGVEAASKILWS
jgi:aspartate aminotransferase-like enzyme